MELNEARKRIDEIDEQIASLFEKRMELSGHIAEYKRARLMPTLDSSREEEKLASISKLAKPEIKPYTVELFKEIISLSREYQNSVRENRL